MLSLQNVKSIVGQSKYFIQTKQKKMQHSTLYSIVQDIASISSIMTHKIHSKPINQSNLLMNQSHSKLRRNCFNHNNTMQYRFPTFEKQLIINARVHRFWGIAFETPYSILSANHRGHAYPEISLKQNDIKPKKKAKHTFIATTQQPPCYQKSKPLQLCIA